MADSDIVVSDLTTAGLVGAVLLSVTASGPAGRACLPYLQPARYEYWEATTNNFALASKVGESPLSTYVRSGITDLASRYYWVIPRDSEGRAGARYPLTLGVAGAATLAGVQPALDELNLVFTTKINEEKDERVSADGALASRTSTLEARATHGTTGFTALSARINNEEDARVSAVQAVVSRTSSLEATVFSSSTGLANTRARVVAEEAARASADAALALSVQSVDASMGNAWANNRVEMRANVGGNGPASFIDIVASQSSGGPKTFSGVRLNGSGDVDITTRNLRVKNQAGQTRLAFDTNTGELNVDVIRAKSLNASQLVLNDSIVTDLFANNAVTDSATFTGSGGNGLLVQGSFTVTHGKVLIIAAGFLGRPTSNSNNNGNVNFYLRANGATIKSVTTFYDDNFGFGVPMVHSQALSPGTYTFGFYANATSGLGWWSMTPGSTLTVINLKA